MSTRRAPLRRRAATVTDAAVKRAIVKLAGRGAYHRKTAVRTRYPRTLRGKGGFFGDAWNWIKKKTPVGALSGIGDAIGGAPGGMIGHGLSKILGFGDYEVKSNSLMHTNSQVPAMHSAETGVRVVHKEYLQDISSSVAFATAAAYDVNPGLSSAFPWLSAMAANLRSGSREE